MKKIILFLLLLAIAYPVEAKLRGPLEGNADTATALSTTPDKCNAGNFPLGIDSDGDAQDCTDVLTQAELIDEDDMASDSATRPPSQQSVKAYVDAQDNLQDQCSEITGCVQNAITASSTDTLTNKTISGSSNTISNVDDDTVNFDDADSNWTATTIGAALEELNDVINGGLPNAANGKLDWSQIVNVPSGFADGVDNSGSSGGGTTIDVQEDGSTVVQTGTLDFDPVFIITNNGGKADIAIGDLFVFSAGDSMTGTLNLTSGATINSTAFTASRALVAGTGKDIETSSVTSTELGHLSGVTSAVQTQLNNKQAADADLNTYAGITPSANVQSLLAAANYAAMRTLLDLEAGTDFYSIAAANAAFQPLDGDLTDLADGTLSASKVEDIWVNTAGDTMTGTLNFTTGAEPLVNSVQVCLEDGTNCPAGGIGDITAIGNCSTGDAFTGGCGTTISSNTDLIFDLDQDNNGSESFQIRNGADTVIAEIDELGGLTINQVNLGSDEAIQFPSATITETGGDLQLSGADFEIIDDLDFILGTNEDWKIQYDEGVDNQLLFATTNTSAIATTDPMFEILVGTTPTADQQVFGVAKGTQATNTPLLTLDEDGDMAIPGTMTIAGNLACLANGTCAGYQATITDGTGLTFTGATLNADAASTSAVGVIEVATAAEIDTATSSSLAVSPNELNDSDYGAKSVGIQLFEYNTTVTTGTMGMITVPPTMDTWELKDMCCAIHTQGVTGSTDITIYRRRSGSNLEMLSTDVTIGAEQGACDETVNTSNDDLATGDVLIYNVTGVHSGTAPKGLSCTPVFRRP